MEINNYAQIYTSHGENFSEKDINELNEWLSKTGVKIQIESDADGITLRVFNNN